MVAWCMVARCMWTSRLSVLSPSALLNALTQIAPCRISERPPSDRVLPNRENLLVKDGGWAHDQTKADHRLPRPSGSGALCRQSGGSPHPSSIAPAPTWFSCFPPRTALLSLDCDLFFPLHINCSRLISTLSQSHPHTLSQIKSNQIKSNQQICDGSERKSSEPVFPALLCPDAGNTVGS